MWAVGTVALRRSDPSDLIATIRAEEAFDACERLADVLAPTLVVGGGRDVAYEEALFRLTADRIPGARRLFASRWGHAPAGTKVVDGILAFLGGA